MTLFTRIQRRHVPNSNPNYLGVWVSSNEFEFGFGFVQVPKLPNGRGLSLGLAHV
jgi:hypothetical protein